MSRTIFAICAISLCVNAWAEMGPDGAPIEREFKGCANLQCGTYIADKFALKDKVLGGRVIRGETFFASEDLPNNHKTIFKPKQIRYVYNPTTGEIYVPGKDYIATEEGIRLTEKSSIKRCPRGFVNKVSQEEVRLYRVRVTLEYQDCQYAITYEKLKPFFPKTYGKLGGIRKLAGKSVLRITFFGDSITAGANATSKHVPPNQPGYVGLVMAYLNDRFPQMWEHRNNSVSGWNTFNAVSAANYRVNDQPSDLIVLAFGMNDSNEFPASDYKTNLQKVIATIRSTQPNTPILLVSSTVANPESSIQKRHLLHEYLAAIKELTTENQSVAVADVTTTWEMMLRNKRYYDLTGNGLNHPNDFGHRVIAEAVLKAMLRESY